MEMYKTKIEVIDKISGELKGTRIITLTATNACEARKKSKIIVKRDHSIKFCKFNVVSCAVRETVLCN